MKTAKEIYARCGAEDIKSGLSDDIDTRSRAIVHSVMRNLWASFTQRNASNLPCNIKKIAVGNTRSYFFMRFCETNVYATFTLDCLAKDLLRRSCRQFVQMNLVSRPSFYCVYSYARHRTDWQQCSVHSSPVSFDVVYNVPSRSPVFCSDDRL